MCVVKIPKCYLRKQHNTGQKSSLDNSVIRCQLIHALWYIACALTLHCYGLHNMPDQYLDIVDEKRVVMIDPLAAELALESVL